MSDSEKKLFIDEDWKAQVEAEKEKARAAAEEAAAKQPEAAPPVEAGPVASSEPTAAADDSTPAHGELPPPTLEFLISTLASQAMVALGAIANPFTGKAETDFPQARHFIDMLAMLEEKTKGNRTERESLALDTLLHQLRMAFVEIQRGA